MGFFSSLFGNKKRSEQTSAFQPQNKVRKYADKELYFQLLEILVSSNSARDQLKREIIKAFDEPESFYDADGEYELAIRGLRFSKDADATPKFVFIDKLIEEELMAEVDWKEEEAEIRRWVIAIMKVKSFPFSVSEEDQYEDMSTDAVIQMMNDDELIPNGYSLQILDIQSDCYVFTIVPAEDSKTIKELFAEL